MKIEKRIQGTHAVIQVTGRLDAAWAEHFLGVIQEVVRDGLHHVRVDASALEYLSSAGIRSLLKSRRELEAVHGSFGIVRASTFVEETLRMSGLDRLLVPEDAPGEGTPSPVTAAAAPPVASPVAGMRLECHGLAPDGCIALRLHEGWRPWQTVQADDAVETGFPRQRFGLGIGAPGRDAEDVRSRFGEFVAAAGCLAWQPGDGADRPDYLEQEERFVPRLHVIQALVGEGAFSHLLRFSPAEIGACVNLSDLCRQVLQTTRSGAAAMVALAEVEGLVGTALLRSPGLIQAADRPDGFPEVRNWMAFCGERVHRGAQALVVAFLVRDSAHLLASHLLPLPALPEIRVHAHAVVLPFRSLPQGVLEIEPSVRAAFEDSAPLGLLHLIEDDRPVVGLGQSAFIRGACWCAPLQFSKEPLS